MSPRPRVSILLLNCNGIEDTRLCMASLLPTLSDDVECILWDNGSSAEEKAALEREFGARVRLYGSPVNLGITGGNNGAAAHARGDILVLLNNDTEVTPGWLAPLLAAFDDPAVGACQPRIRSWYERDRFDHSGAAGGFLDRFGYPYARGRLFFTREPDSGQYDTRIDIHWASAACMAIRRDLWEQCGGMDDRFFVYMDEIDLCWKLRNAGYRIVYEPDSLIFHKGARTMRRFPYRKRLYEHRNNLLMMLKNLPFTDLLWRLPCRLLLEWVSIAYYLCTGNVSAARAVVTSFFWFLILAPVVIIERAPGPRVSLSGPSVVWEYFCRGRRRFSELPAVQ